MDEAVFVGWWNVFFLAVIVAAVFVQRPEFLREGLMLAAAAGSFLTTGEEVHEANQFHFGPMLEVAVLFFGIFATMMPALDLLRADARQLFGPHLSASAVYWGAGTLSAFLDSAPAYLAFFSALSSYGDREGVLAALSVATVLFGAVTYIGNGPNLMVKVIADHQKAPAPSFVAYLFKWAAPVMLPLLMMLWIVFYR